MTSIIGLATALPVHSVSQEESCSHAAAFTCESDREKAVLQRLYRRTEIDRRGSVVAERESLTAGGTASASFFPPPKSKSDKGPTTSQRMDAYDAHAKLLSLSACRQALAGAQTYPDEITHLITVSCTGFAAPGFDLHLLNELPLNRDTYRTHIGFMGCHGTMNALRVAQGFLKDKDERTKILLCATEICSIHFQYSKSPHDILANSLFADGAAALILANAPGRFTYKDSMSCVVESSEDAMSWRIGDYGFTMSLSAEVPRLIESRLPHVLENWLRKNDLSTRDIAAWAIHPGGPRIIDAVERSLQLAPELTKPSRDILAECGNMSSPTVLFILKRILACQKRRFPCVILGFGPGLTIEAALLTE